jgi:hypothetical protein
MKLLSLAARSEKDRVKRQLMPQTDVSLDFLENSSEMNKISNQPVPESLPQPLAEWLTRILARVHAAQTQPDS